MTTLTPVIRPEETVDAVEIRRVVAAAFGREVEADLVDRIRDSPGYLPDLSLVAEVDGEIVGHVMVSTATLLHETGERLIAMLSPLAVEPSVQRCGVGRALVEAVSTLADDWGHPFIVLEGSPTYYGRLGFEPASRFAMTLPLPSWAPPEAAQLLRLSTFDSSDATMAGNVVYPPAFDGLD